MENFKIIATRGNLENVLEEAQKETDRLVKNGIGRSTIAMIQEIHEQIKSEEKQPKE